MGKQPRPQNLQSQAADNTRYEPARKAKPNAKPEQPSPACRQKRQGRKHTTPAATKAQARPKSADNHKSGQEAPPDQSETLPPKCVCSPPPTPTLNRCQKIPPNKGRELPPEIQVNAGTSKANPKTEFWRATETNRLPRSLPKKEGSRANRSQSQTEQRQKPNCKAVTEARSKPKNCPLPPKFTKTSRTRQLSPWTA